LRGLHANDEVRKALKEIRSDGPELPRDRKEKDKILKDEFKKAIEQAAEAVGHEASTLRSQYLAPVIEKSYLHDGTVPDRLDKKAGATVLVGGDGESKAWVQGFFRRHPRYPAWARLVEYALATVKTATLDESEKEEREDKRLIQKDTKFKPPRQDLRRRDVEDRDTRGDDDPDEKQDEKDRSKNYKDASLIQRVASRYMSVRVVRLASDAELRQEFLEEHGDKEYTSPTTGNKGR
jgi:hypothetical protein